MAYQGKVNALKTDFESKKTYAVSDSDLANEFKFKAEEVSKERDTIKEQYKTLKTLSKASTTAVCS